MQLLEHPRRETVGQRDYWRGTWHGHELIAVLSRIGKVAAATTATALVERYHVRGMVFTGVAGGLADGVAVGDVVVGSHFLQHDLDVSPLFARYEVPHCGVGAFAADPVLGRALQQASAAMLSDTSTLLGPRAVHEFGLQGPRLHHGLLVSGDRFVASSIESAALRQALPQALAVEMEGAAVAQVCYDYGVPFAAVRTISDRADDSAHHDFNRFLLEVASRYSAAIVAAMLRAI